MNGLRARQLPALLRMVGTLSLATLASATGTAAEPQAEQATAPAPVADARDQDAEQRAVERARQALEARHEWIEGLTLESVTPTQWSDSSLGCRQPGGMYMQVITSGYTVTFAGEHARREVHVAGDKAVVCTGLRGALRTPAPRVPLRNLDAMIAAARTDLATRIGAKPEAITLVGWSPVRLPVRVLHCEVAAADPSEPAAPGYKILLGYQGRTFAYQSDMQSAIACPPIERE
jgi:hypothetical protein